MRSGCGGGGGQTSPLASVWEMWRSRGEVLRSCRAVERGIEDGQRPWGHHRASTRRREHVEDGRGGIAAFWVSGAVESGAESGRCCILAVWGVDATERVCGAIHVSIEDGRGRVAVFRASGAVESETSTLNGRSSTLRVGEVP
jgi:hypothetical protein